MQLIFGILYTVLFLSFVVTALFIVFHLLRYTLNRKMAVLSTILFLSVFTILLITNAMIFFSLPLADLLPMNSL